MDQYIIYFLLLVPIVNVVTARSALNDYYWRDYTGVIPGDALRAGHDRNGKPIYVGQVLHDMKLIPGKIFEDDENIYYEFEEQAWSTNENVKILCTGNPKNYEWIQTTVHDVYKLQNLVSGGYQPNFQTFIGRVHDDGRTDIGKVICGKPSCLALYTNRDGYYKEYHTFEILTYNPYIENDVRVLKINS